MNLDPIHAISPLDGRYHDKTASLASYFSEYALIRYRIFVELEWFIFLCNEAKLKGTRVLKEKELAILRELSTEFESADALRVKEIERRTNHDVKAVEYFIREHLQAYPSLNELVEYIHFGCTSEDINNLSYALLLKDFEQKEYFPLVSAVVLDLLHMARNEKATAMLSHTHGQPASPTTLGKELINFVARLERQLSALECVPHMGKMNGAVGNFNAHVAAFPNVDWIGVSHRFVSYLGLKVQAWTTQIEPHDELARRLDSASRINSILIDLCRDIWTYISFGYFKQGVKPGEVGSSTMPHKVNPIDFENAEGNFGLANGIFRHLSDKLPVSRLQRDLSDSTVLRSLGVGFGYSVIGFRSILKGLGKLNVDKKKIAAELNAHWELLAEPIQTVLRKYKVEHAYDMMKDLTRGKEVTARTIAKAIAKLPIPALEKKRLQKLRPDTYIGLASQLVQSYKPTFVK